MHDLLIVQENTTTRDRCVVRYPLHDSDSLHQLLPHTSRCPFGLHLLVCSNGMSTMSAKAEDVLCTVAQSRLAPNSFIFIRENLARLIGRTMGLAMFFSFMNPTREESSTTPSVPLYFLNFPKLPRGSTRQSGVTLWRKKKIDHQAGL